MPTVGRFFDSNAFYRGLMGPLGSGKSSACVWELAQRGVRQAPDASGRRKSRWVVIRNCFDADTEILTELRGWVKFPDLCEDDKVATLKDGERLEYELPSYYYAAPHKGEMIGVKNEGIDLLVTPTHHLWVTKTSGRNRRRTPYRHERAIDCYGMIDWRMKRDAQWDAEAPARFSVDFFELLGFWFAEGYAGAYEYQDRAEPHWRWVITQTTYCDYVRDLLRRAGVAWGEGARDGGGLNFRMKVTPDLKPLVGELAALGRAHEKHLPAWLKAAPRAHLRAFLAGYMLGDGTIRKGGNTIVATTASRRLADDVQEIALRAGYVVNVRTLKAGVSNMGPVREMYSMTFLTEGKYHPKTKKGWFKRDYDGQVYCVEVSSHVVYVRRNGVAVWSGQTFKELEDTTQKTFLQWFPPHVHGDWVPSRHEYTIRSLKASHNEPAAEIEILFRALDRPDQVKSLLSLELTGGWINEAREVPWAILEGLSGRVGRYPAKRDGGATWSGIIMDTNPPDSDSDWYRFFETKKGWEEGIAALAEVLPGGMTEERFGAIFKQPSGTSPNAENLDNLPPGYYQRLAIGKADEWVKVYVHGEYGFVNEGKAVFPEYLDSFHCPAEERNWPKPIKGLEIYRGWDFGLTPAVVFSQITPDGRWIIFDELVATSMGIDRFSDQMLEKSRREYRGFSFVDIGDPAGMQRAQTDEKTCYQILHSKGILIEPAPQTLTLRLEGTRRPMRMLVDGKPQFVLHPRCKVLRRGLQGGYHYRRLRISGETYTSEPMKNSYSHVCDGLTYTGAYLFGDGLLEMPSLEDADAQYAQMANDRTRSSVTGY